MNTKLVQKLLNDAIYIENTMAHETIAKEISAHLRLAASRLEARGEISEAMVVRFIDRFVKDYPAFWDRTCAECVRFPGTSVPMVKLLNVVRAALEAAQKGETP